MLNLIKFDFLDKQGAKNMKKATYHGTDNSLCYTYFYSPLCGYLVDNWAPSWMS